MIFSLICLLAFVILIAVFIGKNLGNSCSIWFFKDFGQTNIVVIIFIAFAAGIITSLLLFFIGRCLKQVKQSKSKSDSTKKEHHRKIQDRSEDRSDRSQKSSRKNQPTPNSETQSDIEESSVNEEIKEKEKEISAENKSK